LPGNIEGNLPYERKKEENMGFGKELVQSAEEALAIARGEAEPGVVYVPPRVEFATIRKKLGFSHVAFANRYGLAVGTLRDWEQNRRSPDRSALVLLELIRRNPQMVAEALQAKHPKGFAPELAVQG